MSEKRLLQAAVLLVRSLKAISRRDVANIHVLTDHVIHAEPTCCVLSNYSVFKEGRLTQGESRRGSQLTCADRLAFSQVFLVFFYLAQGTLTPSPPLKPRSR
jgi:hypothetical protein